MGGKQATHLETIETGVYMKSRILATSTTQIIHARSVWETWSDAVPFEAQCTRKGRRALWSALAEAGLPTSWVRVLVWGAVPAKRGWTEGL